MGLQCIGPQNFNLWSHWTRQRMNMWPFKQVENKLIGSDGSLWNWNYTNQCKRAKYRSYHTQHGQQFCHFIGQQSSSFREEQAHLNEGPSHKRTQHYGHHQTETQEHCLHAHRYPDKICPTIRNRSSFTLFQHVSTKIIQRSIFHTSHFSFLQ